jgi:NOL1/NOP2/fmu family ribosome biogenesis protein
MQRPNSLKGNHLTTPKRKQVISIEAGYAAAAKAHLHAISIEQETVLSWSAAETILPVPTTPILWVRHMDVSSVSRLSCFQSGGITGT